VDSPQISSLSGSCTQGQFNQFSANQWACNSTVEFYSSSSPLAAQIQGAVAAWQSRLSATGMSGLPFFTTTSVPGNAEATATGSVSGSAFCGNWSEANKLLTIYNDAGCSSYTNTASLPTLLLHEVGHAVGWTGSSVHKAIFVTGVSDHCVMQLPDDGSMNPTICAHEVEGVLAGYGLTTYDSENFYNVPFVVASAATLSPVSLEVNETHGYAPGNWQLDRGGTVSGTGTSYTWTSSNTQVATVTAGTVTAVGEGTATIRATPAQSSSYLFAHPFRTAGATATVTVTEPELSPINLAVTGISSSASDSMPIYDPGTYSLLALIGAGDTTGVTYKWIVKYSHMPNDSIVSHAGVLPPWGGRASSFNIANPIGSYTVTVRAIPGRVTIVGSDTTRTVGSAAVRDFTVCPRPEGAPALRVEVPGGEGTNAVHGCS
jgi:hypothetical protein